MAVQRLPESTFHHFADYNWDPAAGCPSFVSEAPGDGLRRVPEALADTHRYALNIAAWLCGALGAGQKTARYAALTGVSRAD